MTKRPQVLYLCNSQNMQVPDVEKSLRQWATVWVVETLSEMVDFLAEGSVDVVLCDWNFLDGTWKEALREIQGRYPRLPSIVISPTQGIEEGIQEWLDVLSAGAFDLLLNPSNDLSLRSVLEHAVASGEGRMMHAGM